MEPTSEERILAGFCHLMIIFGWYGTAAAFVIWFVKRHKSEFITQSAKQAVIYQIMVLGVMGGFNFLWQNLFQGLSIPTVPLTAEMLGIVPVMIVLVLFLYGVAGATANFRGKTFKYALIGNLIDKYLN